MTLQYFETSVIINQWTHHNISRDMFLLHYSIIPQHSLAGLTDYDTEWPQAMKDERR